MVFSGFGIYITEEALVENYFQTAKNSFDDRGGVTNTDTIRGILQIIKDLHLEARLQIDVFVPLLYQYTSSPEPKYIVKAEPKASMEFAKRFEKGSEIRKFYETSGILAKEGVIGLYTANNRMMQLSRKSNMFQMLPDEVTTGFYKELKDFISKGHVLGPHEGLAGHMRALDGSRMEEVSWGPHQEGFVIVDPNGKSYVEPVESLFWIDERGVRGSFFDHLFRLSPREESINPTKRGLHRFIWKSL